VDGPPEEDAEVSAVIAEVSKNIGSVPPGLRVYDPETPGWSDVLVTPCCCCGGGGGWFALEDGFDMGNEIGVSCGDTYGDDEPVSSVELYSIGAVGVGEVLLVAIVGGRTGL
jgi:hypothetical protein